MTALSLLRRLAEQQQFSLLRDYCLAGGLQEPAERVLLALALAHLGEDDEACHWLSTVGNDALGIDTRVDLAAVYLALLRLTEACELLENLLPAAPEHSLLLARLGWCRMQQARDGEALALYQRSAALQPRMGVLLNLTRLQLQASAVDEAQVTLTQAQALQDGALADWPEAQRHYFHSQLRDLQLAVWLAADRLAEAEAWLAGQRDLLGEDEWGCLLAGFTRRLAERDQLEAAEELLRDGLRHYPTQLPLYDHWIELALAQGRTQQAVGLLRRAIQVAEQLGRDALLLWTRLSDACLQQHPARARQAAERAMALAEALREDEAHPAPQIAQWRAQAELALAAVEAQEQNYGAARERYTALIAAHPNLVPALLGLGQLELQLGQIDAAVSWFEQASQIDPARGHAALINARKFPEDDSVLEKLERLARVPGSEGRSRASLLFPLAAAWEKRKDHARAFQLADEANAASRKSLRYVPAAHRQDCARIRHAFNKALYQHRPDCGVDTMLPVFVVGMPRSGTTLVEQIIASHSQIHGAGELGIVPQVIAGLERWERHTGSGRRYPDCVDDLSPEVTAGIAANVLKEYQQYAPGARHVVDKLPHNFQNIGLIKFLFPRARIISVRRDPRDIAISNYFTDYTAKHGGMGFAYDLRWIGEQLADHNLMMHHWHQLFPGEILEVHYERLIEDAEGEARKLLDYIGVGWEPQVLNFNELERPVKTASVWQVRQPIYTSSTARWRRYETYLAPLIAGTNARIEWQPIDDMASLPEPGLLGQGVASYRDDKLDEAEYRFKQLLQHLPEHAAANFMVGLIYVRKGHLQDGIALMEKAQRCCPWNRSWRQDLAQAYEMAGAPEKAAPLAAGADPQAAALSEHQHDEAAAW